jgi:hypothetical protein
MAYRSHFGSARPELASPSLARIFHTAIRKSDADVRLTLILQGGVASTPAMDPLIRQVPVAQ